MANSKLSWVIITGEYPPKVGGVSDYTHSLAAELAKAGDEVYVLAPEISQSYLEEERIKILSLPGRFGLKAIFALSKFLNGLSKPRRILVQYVPHSFGKKAMNIFFCFWLFSRRKEDIWVMFHEVAFPLNHKQPLRRNILALINRLMAYLITKPANRIFVSTMAWEPLLKKFTAKKIECTPVFSSFICDVDHNAVQREREKILSGNTALLLGHFGAYGAISDSLLAKVFALLLKKPGRIALFIGKGSKEFLSDLEKENPFIHDKAIALGYVEAQAIPALLSACDILVQPYPDGVTTRRSSIVSGLALGKPIVTNIGPLTEKFWFDSRAVFLVNNNEASEIVDATEKLLSDPAEQREISEKAASLYKTVFSLNNTINKLRENQS